MTKRQPRTRLLRGVTGSLMLAIHLVFLASPPAAAPGPAEAPRKTPPRLVWPQPPAPARIEFVQTFSSARDFGWKPSLWRRIVDWVKNESDPSILRRPFAVAVDADGRLVIADTAARDVKIFDPKKQSVSVIRGYRGRSFGVPVSVATDDARNIYVADSGAGRVLKFSPKGKFLDFIGGEEGAFQRPASLTFNPANKLLYVVDTTRPRIFAFSTDGRPLMRFGERGEGPGQFNFPTFIAADRTGRLFVNDTLNFRVQVLTPEGKFLRQFGEPGDGSGNLNRPKGLALDSEGHAYLADALFSTVQVFDGEGRFLVNFGREGVGAGEFYIPAGVAIDRSDRIYVADPYRRRVQVFQYRPASAARTSPAPPERGTWEESSLRAEERFPTGGAW